MIWYSAIKYKRIINFSQTRETKTDGWDKFTLLATQIKITIVCWMYFMQCDIVPYSTVLYHNISWYDSRQYNMVRFDMILPSEVVFIGSKQWQPWQWIKTSVWEQKQCVDSTFFHRSMWFNNVQIWLDVWHSKMWSNTIQSFFEFTQRSDTKTDEIRQV